VDVHDALEREEKRRGGVMAGGEREL